MTDTAAGKRPRRGFRNCFTWIVISLLAGCQGDCGGPDQGDIDEENWASGRVQVGTSTTGSDIPTGFYRVVLGLPSGDSLTNNVATNQLVTSTFENLPAGSYLLWLTGIPPHCKVQGDGPGPISAPVGIIQSAFSHTFDVGCRPNAGTIIVGNLTQGDPGVLEYTITLDGVAVTVGVNSGRSFLLVPVGEHTVEISGVPPHCLLIGEATRTLLVTLDGFAQTVYDVDCTGQSGAIRVTTRTSGSPPDPDGYLVNVDTQTIGFANDMSFVFGPLLPGQHEVRLFDVASNCSVPAATPAGSGDYLTVAPVQASLTTDVTFDVTCGAFGQPVDPAGIWTFSVVVTEANGVCSGEEGASNAHPITITKTGTAPPYDIVASGFLGDPANVLTGTFDANNRLLLSGSYPEDGGTTSPVHDLLAASHDRMEGIETWTWTSPGGSCPDSKSYVVATRHP